MARENFHSDPEAFALVRGQLSPPPEIKTRLVLGLDLGTNCGYTFAFYPPNTPVVPGLIQPMHMGQWDLSAGPYDSGAIRFLRLRYFLAATRPDLVFFEDVKYTPGEKPNKFNLHAIVARAATACELFGAFKGTVSTWCEERNIPCVGFSIQAIKKRATGKGNANKEDLIKACNKIFGANLPTESYESTGADNIADSSFLCLLGMEQLAIGLEKVHETA